MTILYYEPLLQEDINWGTGLATKRNPGGGVLVGHQVGLQSFSVGQSYIEVTWDPPSVLSLSVATTTVAVPGAVAQDMVLASFSVALGGLLMFAQVTASNVVTVTIFNPTGAAINIGSGLLRVIVLRAGD